MTKQLMVPPSGQKVKLFALVLTFSPSWVAFVQWLEIHFPLSSTNITLDELVEIDWLVIDATAVGPSTRTESESFLSYV